MAEAIVRGARFHYQRLGLADARSRVVFIHGLVMDNLASWYFSVANAIAASADVLLYDLRGHGRSERTPDGYSVESMSLDLDKLLTETMGSKPVCIVGNSFGALLAVDFARRFPERVSGLVLVDGHLGDGDFGVRMAQTLSLRGEAADRAIAESFKEWLGRHSERKRTRLADQARALVEGTTLIRDMQSTTPLTREDLAEVDVPTLALYGERSDIRARSEEILAGMPRCALEILPGCTHSILWEATDAVRDRIAAFCQDLVAEKAA